MTDKKIISKEKHFLQYLEKNAPFYGVFGHKARMEKGQFVPDNKMFLVLDANLKVIFESKPFTRNGEFTPAVNKELAKIRTAKNIDRENEFMRTDDSVDELICSLMTNASLDWHAQFHYGTETVGGMELPKKLDITKLNVEKNSPEFERLELAQDAVYNSVKPFSDSSFDNLPIEYNRFTKKGKKVIDDCAALLRDNKSKTIVQDAFIRVLESRNIAVDWKPYDRFAFDLVLKDIDYSSVENLEEKREKRRKAVQDKITPATRAHMREMAKKMKK